MKRFLFILSIVLCQQFAFGQGLNVYSTGVAISNDSTAVPHSSAVLDISSESQGILIPRMDSATIHSIVSPAKGLMAYDTVNGYVWVYNGTVWNTTNSLWIEDDGKVYTLKNVGIGKSDPQFALDCNGSINIPQDSSYYIGENPILTLDGNNNLLLGEYAGTSVTTGTYSVFVGGFAGKKTTTANNNTFIGHCADSANVIGSNKVVIGYLAGSKDTAAGNVFVGSKAGLYSRGSYNLAIGNECFFGNTTDCDGTYNTSLGYRAGRSTTTGSNNISIGTNAGYSTSTGLHNSLLGNGAGYSNSTGSYNLFMGYYAGNTSTTYSHSVKIGLFSGRYNRGNANVIIGSYAGAGPSGSTYIAQYNTLIGYQSGYVMQASASYNTMLGGRTGLNVSSGANNILIGFESGYYLTTGEDNVLIGYQAGKNSSTGKPGSGNVFLGYQAGFNETGSDKLYIDNSDASSSNALIYGEFNNDVLKLNADVIVRDELILVQNSQTSLSGGGTLTVNSSYVLVAGSSGAVTLSSTTPIANGSYVGQLLVLQGNSGSNTVTIGNSGNVALSASVTLGDKDSIVLMWDGTDWVENSRSDN